MTLGFPLVRLEMQGLSLVSYIFFVDSIHSKSGGVAKDDFSYIVMDVMVSMECRYTKTT